ncbi:MAG: glucose-6-phosphate isomerase [Pseudomonadales bacterium]|nr:glucose-6-phosphate isomerase [Pseudomonadales bacterium]
MPSKHSTPSTLTASTAWQALIQHQQEMLGFNLNQAFADNSLRAELLSLESCGIYFDYSKHLIKPQTLKLLFDLAAQQQLQSRIQALFAGQHVNNTEDRPALHTLLRYQDSAHVPRSLQPIFADVVKVKQRMREVSQQVLTGQIRGFSGKPFTDVVHIGIGGSDLGPAMIYQALSAVHQPGIRCHYVANICANDITETLAALNPHTTLFILASKSFTTLETLENANTARRWLLASLEQPEAVAAHFYAVSAKPEKAAAWGVKPEFVLPFWDFVGGRYSSWSAIGLSLCIGLGYEHFEALLSGAAAMDQHFLHAAPEQNMPIILGLLGIWYTNFWQRQAHAVVPYDHRLRRFPQFLQQLEMESTGKCANLDNQQIDYQTCPDIWGEAGSNSQHSFFQQLHQGSDFTPIDFIAVASAPHGLQSHQDWLLANCFAQSRALMLGQTDNTPGLEQHKFMPGNKPSSTLMIDTLTPANLGALMALYEQKAFVQSVIWHINPFDQWGVELGKKLSQSIKAEIDRNADFNTLLADGFDASTASLLQRYLHKAD